MILLLKKIPRFPLFQINKRQKFVVTTLIITSLLFISNIFEQGIFQISTQFILAFIYGLVTDIFLYLIIRKDLKGIFLYPIFILPFLYTVCFGLLYFLFPARFIARALVTIIFAFGLYSLFLAENIFAISSARTIGLLRSARVIAFIITIIVFGIFVLFYLLQLVLLVPQLLFVMPIVIFILVFILSFQMLWFYVLEASLMKEIVVTSLVNSLVISEISLILGIWPIVSIIYTISLAGIFYSFLGMSYSWFERKLFKGILWEYVWVGFLSFMILILFSRWGI